MCIHALGLKKKYLSCAYKIQVKDEIAIGQGKINLKSW